MTTLPLASAFSTPSNLRRKNYMPKHFDAVLRNRLAEMEEIEVETLALAGGTIHRTIVWVVVIGAEVYIRSVRGSAGRWYKEFVVQPAGAILMEGQRIPARAIH